MAKRAVKPTALRAIEGGRSHSLPKPEDVNEPKPHPVAPNAPNDIDADAKAAWDKLAPVLERLGLLTEVDGEAFAILCQIRSRIKAIRTLMLSDDFSLLESVIRVSPDGQERYEFKPNPLTVMERQYYDQFRKFSGLFGLSPRDRVGLTIGMDKDGPGDDLI